jgi:hypothetical protein
LAIRAAVYAVLLIAFTTPVSLDPGARRFAEGPDTRLYLWTLGWDLHALKTDPLRIFDANIFFPETKSLAYSEHLIGAAALALPLSFFTSNLDLILNFVLLLSTLLTALGCDFLARACGASPRGALLAGIAGGFSGARLTRLTQAHLATLHFVPWALGFALLYIREQRRRDLLACLALFTAQAITSGHGGLFLAFALAVVFAMALVARGIAIRTLVRDIGLAGALIVAINVPFVIPYYEVKKDVGLTRVIEDAEGYAPTLASWFVAPTRTQTFLAERTFPAAAANANADLFPGFVFAGLALYGAFATLRRSTRPSSSPPSLAGRVDSPLVTPANPDAGASAGARVSSLGMCLLAFLSLWLCLGPSFGLYRLFYAAIPGFDLIRVPSRFFLLTLTVLAALAAIGLDRIRRPAIAWTLIVLATIECIPTASASAHDPIVTPPIDAWLATRPKPFRVVELPIPQIDNSVRQARFHSEYMIHGAAHWQPMVNGYSSLVPPRHEKLYAALRDFPTKESVAALERLGVDYVIVHTEMYQPDRWAEKEAALAFFGERLRLVRVEGEGRAYAIGAIAGRVGK